MPGLIVAPGARLRRVYRGWWIVWISYYSQVITAGAGSWVFGSLILSMQGDLGWNQKTVVGVLILNRWISGLLSLALGPTVDRHGSRILMTGSALLAGVGLMTVSLAQSPLMFYAAWALFGAAQPGVNLLGPRVTISNWFVRKRTQAFVILTVGGASAGFIAVPLAAQIDAHYGWRAVWMVLGLLCWTVAPLTWWAFRRRPEDIGLLPDGDHAVVAGKDLDGHEAAPKAVPLREAPWTVKEALLTRSFWLLTLGFLCVGMPGSAIIINISGFMQGFGYSKEVGASVVSVYGLGVLGSRPVWGVLLSRLGLHRTLVAFAATYATAILIFTLQDGARLGIYITTLSLGIAIGGSQLLNTQALPDYYGRRIVGSLTGFSQLANTAVGGSAPLLTAAVFDATGGYVPAFLFFAAACVAAGVAFFFSPPPVHPSERSALASS